MKRWGFQVEKKYLKERIELHLGLFDTSAKFIGWTSSFQLKPNELFMMNSAVLPRYRRKGCYAQLLKATIDEAKKQGF